MGYKILLMEKSQEEYFGDYHTIQRLIESTKGLLSYRGHTVSVATELGQLTDQLYSNQDLVIAHPTGSKLSRVLELHSQYPRISLLIVTGPGKDENTFHELAKDEEGVYFLIKPYTASNFLGAIEKIIKESLELVQKPE